MRNNLPLDTLVVLVTWLTIFTVLFAFYTPGDAHAALLALKSSWVYGFMQNTFHWEIPLPEEGTLFNLWGMQKTMLLYWTLPLLSIWFIGTGAGALLAYRGVTHDRKVLAAQVARGTPWRGFEITMGEMPAPVALDRADIDVVLPETHAELTDAELDVMYAILSTLAAYPDAYVGDGHGCSLLQHSVNVMKKVAEAPDATGLLLLAALAHDLGKITAWEKRKNLWVQIRMHDRESGRILAAFPETFALPDIDRRALILAISYDHKPHKLPVINEEIHTLAKRLIEGLRAADSAATKTEKAAVLAAAPVPELILNAFKSALPKLPFQVPGQTKEKRNISVGWRKGNRVYLLEHRIREAVIKGIPDDVRASLGDTRRYRGTLAPFTVEFLSVMDELGWLVRTVGEMSAEPLDALWRVQAGKVTFNAVIILDLPAQLEAMLPDDAPYVMTVLSLNNGGPEVEMTIDDMDPGLMFKHPAAPLLENPDTPVEDGDSPAPEVERDATHPDDAPPTAQTEGDLPNTPPQRQKQKAKEVPPAARAANTHRDLLGDIIPAPQTKKRRHYNSKPILS